MLFTLIEKRIAQTFLFSGTLSSKPYFNQHNANFYSINSFIKVDFRWFSFLNLECN